MRAGCWLLCIMVVTLIGCSPRPKSGFAFVVDNNSILTAGPVLHCRPLSDDYYCQLTPRHAYERIIEEGVFAGLPRERTRALHELAILRAGQPLTAGQFRLHFRFTGRQNLLLMRGVLHQPQGNGTSASNEFAFLLPVYESWVRGEASSAPEGPEGTELQQALTEFLRRTCGVQLPVQVVRGAPAAAPGQIQVSSTDGVYWRAAVTCPMPLPP